MKVLNPRTSTERNEHWRAFGPEWFQRHQNWLLFGLNTPGLSTIVRGLLCIKMSDVWMPKGTKVWAIAPNSYTVRLPDGQLRTDFRTHWKYSKRVYYAFKELWWLMHAWDSAFADRWAPAYSFGFLTLTAYPDPDPETTTVDGDVKRAFVGETWTSIQGGAGNGFNSTTTLPYATRILASGTTDQWQDLYRAIFLFDTSALTASAVISATVFSLVGFSKADALSITPNVDVYTSNPASNTALENADFTALGSTSQTGAAKAYANWVVDSATYNDLTFNATGRSNVSKTGVSKFGTRNANYDVANQAPTWSSGAASEIRVFAAENADTTTDPKLVVTYTLPVSYIPRSGTQMGAW